MIDDFCLNEEILMKRIHKRDDLILLNGLIIPHQKQVKNPILIKVKYGHHLRILVVLEHPVVMILRIYKLLVHHLPIRMRPVTLWQVLLIVGQLLD